MILERFHPAVASWFESSLGEPTEPQYRGWPSIQAGRHTLIAAPTGSGKTLAAFLAAIDNLVRAGVAAGGRLPDATQVVYVSPLKALSNDIQRNLEEPLAAIRQRLVSMGLPDVEIRTLVRTGDTPASQRAAMVKRPPHIVVTTPESLYILLTSERGRRMLRTTKSVIVDEIHALVRDKRGSHLALSLERLAELVARPPVDEEEEAAPGFVDRLFESAPEAPGSGEHAPGTLTRIGLSATQSPIEEVARYLVGCRHIENGTPNCTIVDAGHARPLDIAIEMPPSPLEAVMSHEVWEEIYARLAALIEAHRTTLVFVNTRRQAERVAWHLSELIGEEHVTSHHGSLAREQRHDAEQRLKSGALRALVATASLELGIDVGAVELVCQLGSTRSIATFLQRVGRSGHHLRAIPKGRLFPLSRDELVESAALFDAVHRGELDQVSVPRAPLDILAQQIVASVACEEWTEDALFELVLRAYPYGDVARQTFDDVVRMLSDGFSTRRGRRGAYLHRDAVNQRLRGRRGARLASITSGGAIPDNADYEVVQEPTGTFIGTINEDFAIESMAGDIFQLGNTSWRIVRVEPGRVRVQDAHGQPPNIPFWLGEAPSRTHELSHAVSRLREVIGAAVDEALSAGNIDAAAADEAGDNGQHPAGGAGAGAQGTGPEGSVDRNGSSPGRIMQSAPVLRVRSWLENEVGVAGDAVEQLLEYLVAARKALGVMPTQDRLVLERFFDESGGMQLVLHAPFGSRLNRAWGLSLRKRFCQRFNFELQAAATEDAIVLSLGETHSFPLESVAGYLKSQTVRDLLVQALLDAPMFETRWRWNVSRALAVLRFRSGKKVPPRFQRMDAADLLTVVFPDQVACFENLPGKREVPDHPLVEQTVRDCLEEAMDIDAFEDVLRSIERGDRTIVGRDVTEPSPLSQEILTARPYAFLDDAPLEERRTQAVYSRRWLDAETAADLGALDAAAIARVEDEAWPDVASADELHDALMLMGFVTEAEVHRTAQGESSSWPEFFAELVGDRRATRFSTGDGPVLWVAAERLDMLRAVHADATLDPEIPAPPSHDESWTRERALVEITRGRLESLGVTDATALAAALGVETAAVDTALLVLESEGFVLRGQFTPATTATEWCERRLLARIHRYTLNRLRSEIEPVSSADYQRFLFAWHRLDGDADAVGGDVLASVLDQLEGFEVAAAAWEQEVLAPRVGDYGSSLLDALCLSGRYVWLRLTTPRGERRGRSSGPIRTTPIAILRREQLDSWRSVVRASTALQTQPSMSSDAKQVLDFLRERGASFFADVVSGTGLLTTRVEAAMAELVASGHATSDSFSGLRSLLVPAGHRPSLGRHTRRHRAGGAFSMDGAGRWTRLMGAAAPVENGGVQVELMRGASGKAKNGANGGTRNGGRTQSVTPWSRQFEPAVVECIARALLRRYGVVFRRMLERETAVPPWRELLRVFRRLEARGEVRGGRFVAGHAGDQFALPEAVGQLRAVRRARGDGAVLAVSASDPLNLVGVLTPGERVPALAANRVVYRDGVPIAVRVGGEVKWLADCDRSDRLAVIGSMEPRRLVSR